MVSARHGSTRRKKPQGPGAPGTWAHWQRSLYGIALVLLVASVLSLVLSNLRERHAARVQLGAASQLLAQAAGRELGKLRQRLEALATDPGLREAFESHSPARLESAQKELVQRLPTAAAIHLFAPEEIGAVEGIPYMSFAGLDLARQAAQDRKTTSIEVHKVGHPEMHLAIAAPVMAEQDHRAIGVIHVALPLSILPNPAGAAGARGVLRYRQVVRDDAAVLGAGDPPPAGVPDLTQPVPDTRLQVAGWLVSEGVLDLWSLTSVLATLLASLAAIAGVLWLGWRGLQADLLKDLAGLKSMVDDAVNHRAPRKSKAVLAETQASRDEIALLLRSVQSGRPPLRGGGVHSDSSLASDVQHVDELLGPSSYLHELSVEVEEIDAPENFDPYSEPLTTATDDISVNPLEAFAAPRSKAQAQAQAQPRPQRPAVAPPATAPIPPLAPKAPPPAPRVREAAPKSPAPKAQAAAGAPARLHLPPEIFRAYDIRGIVDRQLGREALVAIGRAIASEALAQGDDRVVVGRDSRASSPGLCAALAEGIRGAGADVLDLGVVPAPLLYFACCWPDRHAGAMVTGSHNPAEYNGVKPVIGGASLDGPAIQDLYRRIEQGELASGSGGYATGDILEDYRSYLTRDVALARGLKVVVDCGNATASAVAPELYRALGCEVIELNCDLGAGMGESPPDPARPERLADLGALVRERGADLGLGFDGDGDRLGVVDSQGRFVAADRVLMLLAADVLSRHPGSDVIFDVKCTRHLADEVRRAGGRPIMWRSGHAPLKAKLRESGALLAGELSGHIVYGERWFDFDDALYAGARLMEVLSLDPRPTQEVFAQLPEGIATPELTVALREGEPAQIMARIMHLADRLDGVDVIRIDGLRAEFERGWGLVRASNTEPKLSFRFEGDDQRNLDKIKSLFRRLMEKAAPGLGLPF
jgi:phosphomannomutase/phosphoglucomutase